MADSRKRDFIADRNDPSSNGNTSDASPIDARPVSSSYVEETDSESFRIQVENESTDILVNDGEGDGGLILGEDMVLRWLQALDMQVMGACRADERLKPLLKLNVSNGMAEDRLLAHLSQHFEPAEIGMLARCFCIPLVSVRVGRIEKDGTRMCPTATRGSLSLMLLPTSDLRLSFNGDNGHSERLFTFSSKSQCFAVSIEDISADSSGRSFVIRIPDGRAFYYWCSEKSKLLGIELRRKMKNLMRKKPSISELTGIDESRLASIASHLGLYLTGSVAPNVKACPSDSSSSSSIRTRHSRSQPAKASSFHQGSLSPRSSSFKENSPRISSLRISSRDKSKRRSDASITSLEASSPQTITETSKDIRIHSPLVLKEANLEHRSVTLTQLQSPILPPLSSLLPPSASDALTAPSSPLNLSDIPPFLPDSMPFVRLSLSGSQQIPTFTPLMCDPIVHIPVIDVCSSGQSYFVSAGLGIPSSIPPLHPQNDSLLEKGARETLRLLISGSNTATAAAPLINVWTKSEDRPVVMGNRGLYSGALGIDMAVGGISNLSLFEPLPLQPPVSVTTSKGSDVNVDDAEATGGSDRSIPPKELPQ